MRRLACTSCGSRRVATLVVLAAIGVFLIVPSASGGPVGTLTTFTNGTTADANEVNANFSAIRTEVNDNDSRITALEGAGAPGSIFRGGSPFFNAGNFDGFDIGVASAGLGEPRQTIIAPRNGVLRNLFLRPDSAPNAGAEFTATIRINGVDTGLTVTHAANTDAGNAASNTVTTVNISQGDRLSIHYTGNATPGSRNYATTFEWQ